MKRYKLSYKGKSYKYMGKDTGEVMAKFANRKVFGNPIICGYVLKQYDADTQGEQWAQYKVDDDFIMIEFEAE